MAEQQKDVYETHYSDKPLNPREVKFVINETVIRSVNRTPLSIRDWRNAHQAADSRYSPNRNRLYDQYDDCLLDGHLDGIIDKRFDTVLNKPIVFRRNSKPVDDLKQFIAGAEFRMICRTILEAKAWGISGLEFIPGDKPQAKLIPRKHIKPKWQIIAYEESGEEGIDYTTASNLFIIGEPEDLGFLLKCVPYAIYKRNALADWARFLEIFGHPIRIMKYEATDQQVKLELKKTLDESGSALALMIPNGVEFDVKDGKQANADGQLQNTFIDFLNREMSVIVLGNTETTTNGQTGSQAKSKVHKEQQDEITRSDMAYLVSWLNNPQFLRILQTYGYPVEGGEFQHTREINIEYLTERIKIDEKVAAKAPVDDDYWYQTYGIEKPGNYNELKKEQRQSSAQPEVQPKAKAKKQPLNSYTPSKLRNLVNALTDFFGHAR